MRPEAGPLGPAYGYLSTHGLSLTHIRVQSIPTYHSGAAKGERDGVLRIGGRGVVRHYSASLSGVSTRTSGKERAQRESIRAHGF